MTLKVFEEHVVSRCELTWPFRQNFLMGESEDDYVKDSGHPVMEGLRTI
jgi:hypothetical protein